MTQPIRNSKADFLSKMTSHEGIDITDNAATNTSNLIFKSSYSETSITSGKITNGQSKFGTYLASKSETYTANKIQKNNGVASYTEIRRDDSCYNSPSKSFIQQRVERLYGPGALAQGFFNMKRARLQNDNDTQLSASKILTEKSLNCSRLNVQYSRELNGSSTTQKTSDSSNIENYYDCSGSEKSSDADATVQSPSLPVLRHLRPEFRAQLPIISPKRSPAKTNYLSPEKIISITVETTPERNGVSKSLVEIPKVQNGVDLVKVNGRLSEDILSSKIKNLSLNEINGLNGSTAKSDSALQLRCNGSSSSEESFDEMDGNYFLKLKKEQTDRLLAMAALAEEYLQDLQGLDVNEEITGLLRSAAGKARLLATQKMQQFEGLCYNNLNAQPGDAFPTTCRDLRGFWDMVLLQVDNVDAIFVSVAAAKESGWKEAPSPQRPTSSTAATSQAVNSASGLGKMSARQLRNRSTAPPPNERAKLAQQKREADRKAMLEVRRKLARERQMAARVSSAVAGTSAAAAEIPKNMAVEGEREVEIFVVGSKSAKSTSIEGGDFSEADSIDTMDGGANERQMENGTRQVEEFENDRPSNIDDQHRQAR